ncbi:hypothetical protein C8E03_1433 [Lachnotalea glycerini]|uniref:Uncharacterized protein n=1 Tax=Lachnotalea glycerini TaxID=1763509 RepID=A0A318EFZ7_9FIRM|nr:hypothetical protein C8E03_1433 [Lachnotalea glycerini]
MTVAGTAETVAGGIGDIFGAVISMSGAGAAAGIPTIAISTDVLITGIAEMAYGISISMTATDNLAGDIKKAQEAAENTDVSKGGSKTFKKKSSSEIEKEYNLKKNQFHREVKKDILDDLSSKDSAYKKQLQKMGKNPDIYLSSDGQIQIVSTQFKGKSFITDLNIKQFLH